MSQAYLTNARPVKSQKRNSSRKFKKIQHTTITYMSIPDVDEDWALQQKPAVFRLFHQCWKSDRYGSRWMVLHHDLKRSTFMAAKKILSDSGLFSFKVDTSIRDARSTVSWLVLNHHGSRVKQFWKDELPSSSVDSNQLDSHSHTPDRIASQSELQSSQLDSISSQNLTQRDFQNSSITPHKLLNNSSKELLEELDRVIPAKNRSQFDPLEGVEAAGGITGEQEQPNSLKPQNLVDSEQESDIHSFGEVFLDLAEEKCSEAELTKKSTNAEVFMGNSPANAEELRKKNEEYDRLKQDPIAQTKFKEMAAQVKMKLLEKASSNHPEKKKLELRKQNLRRIAKCDRALALEWLEGKDEFLRSVVEELDF